MDKKQQTVVFSFANNIHLYSQKETVLLGGSHIGKCLKAFAQQC